MSPKKRSRKKRRPLVRSRTCTRTPRSSKSRIRRTGGAMRRIPPDVLDKLQAAIRWFIGVQKKGLTDVREEMRKQGYDISESRISKEAYRIGVNVPVGRPPGGPGYGGRPRVGEGHGKMHSKWRERVWEKHREDPRLTPTEIARKLGITRQAVTRLLERPPGPSDDESTKNNA